MPPLFGSTIWLHATGGRTLVQRERDGYSVPECEAALECLIGHIIVHEGVKWTIFEEIADDFVRQPRWEQANVQGMNHP